MLLPLSTLSVNGDATLMCRHVEEDAMDHRRENEQVTMQATLGEDLEYVLERVALIARKERILRAWRRAESALLQTESN